MKLLVVSTDGKLQVTAPLWKHMQTHLPFDHKVVVREEGLEAFFRDTDLSGYDRVVADTNLRRLGKRYQVLKGVPGLVVFDHDVCQNNVRSSEWFRRYPAVMRDLQGARLIVSGSALCRQMRDAGIDTQYLPKGFEDELVRDLGLQRDVPFAFVGRVKNKVYRERKRFLDKARKRYGIPVMRAEPGEPYNQLLNRIQIFVSADIGFGEYMIKNFEAMAAGCLLLAWRQPEEEQESLGLCEGENVLLYGDIRELGEKMHWARSNPDKAAEIARRGRELTVTRHGWRQRAAEMVPLLTPAVERARGNTWWEKLRLMGA